MATNDPNSVPLPGDYCLEGDCTYAQFHFFRSIQKLAPEVLARLYADVLPVWKSQASASLPWPNDQHARRVRVAETTSVFDAIWDWAASFNLIATADLPLLKSKRGIHLAYYMMNRPYLHRALPFKGVAPFSEQSPALTFGLRTLCRVATQTLTSWQAAAKDYKLEWSFPQPEQSPQSSGTSLSLEDWPRLEEFLDDPEFKQMVEDGEIVSTGLGLVAYRFLVEDWDPVHETRTDAERRIRNAFELDLQRNLDEHERIAQKLHVERIPVKRQLDHYDFLVHFQVKGIASYAEVTRIVNPDAEVPDPIDPDKFVKATKTIRYGIKNSAKLVVGPDWESSWLLEARPGNPHR